MDDLRIFDCADFGVLEERDQVAQSRLLSRGEDRGFLFSLLQSQLSIHPDRT
jgi:hypothetical protein